MNYNYSNRAINCLSEIIKCRTVSNKRIDENLESEFEKLQSILKQNYKNIFECADIVKIEQTICFKIEGLNKRLDPIVLMAHQDVVDVDSNNISKWICEPFSGYVDNKYIWGRGALDIKGLLVAIMEAVDSLLSEGFIPNRSIYISFGHDEEIGGYSGTNKLVDLFKKEGKKFYFVMDEGFGYPRSLKSLGIENKRVGQIGICEKGYLDLELFVNGIHGHSSNPYNGTSLGIVSNAIAKITNNPYAPYLNPAVVRMLEAIKSEVNIEPLRSYLTDIEKNMGKIIEYFTSNHDLNHLVQTTIAPTMIEGEFVSPNVMPSDISATINFRLNTSESVKEIINYSKRIISDDRVIIKTKTQIEPSSVSSVDNKPFICIEKSLKKNSKDIIFVPSICTCTTDSRHYGRICDSIYRVFPFFNEDDLYDGIHGINERIEIKAFLNGINVIKDIIKSTCK